MKIKHLHSTSATSQQLPVTYNQGIIYSVLGTVDITLHLLPKYSNKNIIFWKLLNLDERGLPAGVLEVELAVI